MGEPLIVVLDLAEHRHDGHQQPLRLQQGRAPRRTTSRAAVERRECYGDCCRRRAVVAREAGVGDGPHGVIVPLAT